MNNLDTWKYLQANGYFIKHNCYKDFQLAKEDPKLIEKIKERIIVEIGCGYGRETYYFSKYAHGVFAIDVCEEILEVAEETVQKFGKLEKVQYILAENYKNIITRPIHFVYAKHVFQHITPEIATDYLNYFKNLLTSDGEVDILFRYGGRKNYPQNKEPLVEYILPEIDELFEGYTITDIIETKSNNYELWRIKANVT